MTVDIFIKTCEHDDEYHAYCLESINKYCSNFRNVIVVKDEHENGYIHQQVVKLHANEYSDADFILVTDSDTLFNRPVTPETFMHDGKPIWYMTPFADLLQHDGLRNWYKVMTDFCGQEPPYEFMRRQPFMFPRKVLSSIQEYCVKTHGRTLKQYPFDKGTFSEWNVLGFYCWLNHNDEFSWVNTDNGLPECPVTQFWSHDPVSRNLEAIHNILK